MEREAKGVEMGRGEEGRREDMEREAKGDGDGRG